jgi:hypothetical protein
MKKADSKESASFNLRSSLATVTDCDPCSR